MTQLTDNLISYWKLDGNSNDAAGSNNGTDTDITYSSGNGKIGQGAGFNGTTSKIVGQSTIILPVNATIACWFKVNGVPSNANIVLFGYKTAGNKAELSIKTGYNRGGPIQFACGDSRGSAYENFMDSSGTTFYDNAWHLAVFVISGSAGSNTITGYVDNVQQATQSGINYLYHCPKLTEAGKVYPR